MVPRGGGVIRIVNQDACTSCGACETAGILTSCPISDFNILGFNNQDQLVVLNPDPCIQCGTCAEILNNNCPFSGGGSTGIRIEFGN